jgi:hypothetical protein
LFDWLNDLDVPEPTVRSSWTGLDNKGSSTRKIDWISRFLEGSKRQHKGAHWMVRNVEDPERQSFLFAPQHTIADSELSDLISEYSSRRWFRRVWVLQEVSLPELHRTKVMCGTKTITAAQALHAISMVQSPGTSSLVRIFSLLYQRNPNIITSPLLDVLIETRDREAADPRDKIFGVLSISRGISEAMGIGFHRNEPYSGESNYEADTVSVYARYSEYFINAHGPGIFWSLFKHPQALEGLPSWSADWTVPWPNYKAIARRDFPISSRQATVEDFTHRFVYFDQRRAFVFTKPQIMKGYFTRDGHLDNSNSMQAEDVANLPDDKILIEIYPGMAVLLRKEAEHFVLIQTCPHAINEDSLASVVESWADVVVDGKTPEERTGTGAESRSYLKPSREFYIC